MTIKAKFHCYAAIPNGYNTAFHFHAVYSQEGENADYAKATPSGNFSLNVDNETAAATFFETGENYYLNIEKAPK